MKNTYREEQTHTFLQNLIHKIGNPLEWGYVNKVLLLIVGQIFVYGILVIYICLGQIFPSFLPAYFSQEASSVILEINIPFILFFIIILVIALRIRQKNPDCKWIAYTTAISITAQDALFLCMIGHATNPQTLLILFLLMFVGLMLFDNYYSLFIIVTWAFIHGFHIIGEQLKLIPYAWILVEPPFKDGIIDTVWLIWTLGSGFFIIAAMLALLGYILHRWRNREAQVTELSDLLKKMFGRYLSTEVMNSLIENPSALELGGERRKVTIMMTDLRGFTALSERLEPEKVVQMLNVYFEVMVDVILQYNGTINEIIGDALLVIFGAPQEMLDRTQRAIACAINMQNAMDHVNEQNRAQGLPELEMGIGLNETEVIVGNIGSSKRSKYAVVGSGVNMTSRIESYTVGGQILISESVRQETGEILRIDAQRDVFPKGSEIPLRIYEIGGIAGQYNLALEGREPALVTVARQIPIGYTVLEGKDVGKNKLEGSVIRLSKNCAEITLSSPINVLANLKMNLKDVDEKLSVRDFYGKVIKHSVEKGGTQLIRFTSVPPEVDAYFQAYREHAEKSERS